MYKKIDAADMALIKAAQNIIRKNYQEPYHTVGAALLSESGVLYNGINIDSVGCGSCAEQVTLGSALSTGERAFKTIVAARPDGTVLPPCGNCRQLLIDYAPHVHVLIPYKNEIVKTIIGELLPNPYHSTLS